MARNSIYHILSNPVYAGIFEYPVKSGNWYKGIHKAMVTTEEFDMIQAILGTKGKPRPKTHVFAFTGLMRCGECNAMITCEEKIKKQLNGNIHRYVYYRCTKRMNSDCSQGYVREKDLETMILEKLNSIEIPSDFHEWALKWLRNQNLIESEDRTKILKMQQKNYNECLSKLDDLIDMRAGKEISEEEYLTKKAKLVKEKQRLEELLADTQNRTDKWLIKADEGFTFARDAKHEFENGDLYKKREIFANLGSKLIIKDRKLHVDLKNSLIPMPEIAKEVKSIHERFEPIKNIDRSLQLGQLYSQNPSLLGS